MLFNKFGRQFDILIMDKILRVHNGQNIVTAKILKMGQAGAYVTLV